MRRQRVCAAGDPRVDERAGPDHHLDVLSLDRGHQQHDRADDDDDRPRRPDDHVDGDRHGDRDRFGARSLLGEADDEAADEEVRLSAPCRRGSATRSLALFAFRSERRWAERGDPARRSRAESARTSTTSDRRLRCGSG
jgi:hypothetical protein